MHFFLELQLGVCQSHWFWKVGDVIYNIFVVVVEWYNLWDIIIFLMYQKLAIFVAWE